MLSVGPRFLPPSLCFSMFCLAYLNDALADITLSDRWVFDVLRSPLLVGTFIGSILVCSFATTTLGLFWGVFFVVFFFWLLRRDPLSLTGIIGNCILIKLKITYQKHQFHRKRPNFWWLCVLTYVCFTKSPAGLRQQWVCISPNNTTVLWLEIYCALWLFRIYSDALSVLAWAAMRQNNEQSSSSLTASRSQLYQQ